MALTLTTIAAAVLFGVVVGAAVAVIKLAR